MSSQPTSINTPWARPVEEVLAQLNVNPERGLSKTEVERRRRQYGLNQFEQAKRVHTWTILADQFKSLIVLLLAIAAAVSFVFQEWVDGIAILIVLIINAALGFFMEFKAVRSMEALRQMERVEATVRRDGEVQIIQAQTLVPGDIVLIEGGDIISADMRLIDSSKLQVDESVLTGESFPAGKRPHILDENVELADRDNMLYKGTAVTRGTGEGVITAIGLRTELGRIAELVETAEESESTPLEKRLDLLGRNLLWVTLVIIVIVGVAGYLREFELLLLIETAVALAVAAIPEGLPVVATITLGRGLIRMARRNALVKQLAAVETLGGVNVICTDKTGTLTENRMTVVELDIASGRVKIEADGFTLDGNPINVKEVPALFDGLKVAALANNATLGFGPEGERKPTGDPMEVALLRAAEAAGIERPDLVEELPEEREEAFDPERKMMATFHQAEGRYLVAVKGAPDSVLPSCMQVATDDGNQPLTDDERRLWMERTNALAERGLRTLALAEKTVDDINADPYTDLTFLGVLGLLDPPRSDVRGSVELAQQAGIQVVMITGDLPVTAKTIAYQTGIIEDRTERVIAGRDLPALQNLPAEERERIRHTRVFARVNPEQKLDLITLHQRAGSLVGMTGDGVNDAPALKKADIGIAMGLRGTQVAREAADMILKDDAFTTIVAAIEQGRIIFDNIRRFVLYLLSANVSEIALVFFALLIGAPLPLLPLQILFLNLVTDVFPAFALGFGEGDPTVMQRHPRNPKESILTRQHWWSVAGYGVLIAASVLCAFLYALLVWDSGAPYAITISFLTLALAQLWHVFNMRDRHSGILRNNVVRNPYVWGALVISVVLILIAVYQPTLAAVLDIIDPGVSGWALVLIASLIPLVVGQIGKIAAGIAEKRSATESIPG